MSRKKSSDGVSFICSCRAKTPIFFEEDKKKLVTCPDCGMQWRSNKEGSGMSSVEKDEPVK